jgi:SM-20-related protein
MGDTSFVCAPMSSCAAELAEFSLDFPVVGLWDVLQTKILVGHTPIRVYGNGHTFGTEGYCHRDSDSDDYFSTIYFAHSQWDSNWGGELVFYHPDGDVIRSVAAKPGRVIHFPGNITHRVASLTKECDCLRTSIIFKTRLEGLM